MWRRSTASRLITKFQVLAFSQIITGVYFPSRFYVTVPLLLKSGVSSDVDTKEHKRDSKNNKILFLDNWKAIRMITTDSGKWGKKGHLKHALDGETENTITYQNKGAMYGQESLTVTNNATEHWARCSHLISPLGLWAAISTVNGGIVYNQWKGNSTGNSNEGIWEWLRIRCGQ